MSEVKKALTRVLVLLTTSFLLILRTIIFAFLENKVKNNIKKVVSYFSLTGGLVTTV